MFCLRSSSVVAPFLILYLSAANGAVVMDICIPRSPEMLPSRTTEIFDPNVIGTGVTMVPICTTLTEPRVQLTVQPSLHDIFISASTINENFHFGYICEGSTFVAKNISGSLPRGVNGQWTTNLLGDDDPLELVLGDTCTFFGCYEYSEKYINMETFAIHSTIYVANFNRTSCIIDRDECSDGSAQCEGECFNVMNGTANSYQCMCGKGFSVSEDQHNCRDVDECAAEGFNNCDQICTVTSDGWYDCSCEDGFTLDKDGHTCEDIDECANNATTLCNTELTGRDCYNTPGSYHCMCEQGYDFKEQHQLCVDIDECAINGTTLCDTELTGRDCYNTPGSYHCMTLCEQGYDFEEQYQLCVEIDVCTELSVDCGAHSKCINSPEENQGYRCDQISKSCSLKGLIHVYGAVSVLLVYCYWSVCAG